LGKEITLIGCQLCKPVHEKKKIKVTKQANDKDKRGHREGTYKLTYIFQLFRAFQYANIFIKTWPYVAA